MKRSSPHAWDLVGCGVLILLLFLTELPFFLRLVWSGFLDWRRFLDYLASFGPPLALGVLLVVAGLYGRKWRARWRSRR